MTTTIDRVAEFPVFASNLPSTVLREGRYEVRFARTAEELDALLRLRFGIFNLELKEGLTSSYETGRDEDEFDPVCHHLMVVEQTTGEVVGTYRMQTSAMAEAYRGFYSNGEFTLADLPAPVLASSIELGRACVHVDHRNTQVLFLLWKGLAAYVMAHQMRYLFGCCSLTSQDPQEGLAVMGHLEKHDHLHPHLRVRPQSGVECYDEGLEPEPRRQVKIPKLFRIYLRHGAKVCGPPAIDTAFKTIDYFVLFDVDQMSERQIRTFFG